jgi:hypothetical protein
MPRTTRTHRRTGKGFPPQYARSLGIDDMPGGGIGGGIGGGAGPFAWQLPPAKRLVNVVMPSRIVQRWADVIPASRG